VPKAAINNPANAEARGHGCTSRANGAVAVVSLEGDWLVSATDVARGVSRLLAQCANLSGIGFAAYKLVRC